MSDLRKTILSKRPICEYCYQRPAVELRHCIVHDSKRFHKLVTCVENLMPVCRECHNRCNAHEVRVDFTKKQIARGYDIVGWYKALPMKVKEQWVFEIGTENV